MVSGCGIAVYGTDPGWSGDDRGEPAITVYPPVDLKRSYPREDP